MRSNYPTTNLDGIALCNAVNNSREQWIQLLPAGTIKTKDHRGPFFAKDLNAIIALSAQEVPDGRIPVDYNHAIDLAAPKGLAAPAAGWISKMEARQDGVWGLVEWTPEAERAVKAREYRYISPVLKHTPDKHVIAIIRASLTNVPNLTMTSLNSQARDHQMDMEEFLASLRSALSLDEQADANGILEAVKKLTQSTNHADPSQFVPISMFQQTVQELNKLRSGVSLQAAQRTADEAVREGKIMPFMRDWAIELCQANQSAFESFLNGAGKPVSEFISSLHTSHKFDHSLIDQETKTRGQMNEVNKLLGNNEEDIKKFGKKV